MKSVIEFLESLVSVIISGCFLLLSLGLSLLEIPVYVDPAWVSVLLSGTPLVYSAIRKLFKNRGITKISSALLISTAMAAAIAIGDLFAAGEIAFIMAIGEILEEKTTQKAKRGLTALLKLTPTQGRRLTESGTEMVSAEELVPGDILRILPGETIPADGIIVEGSTSVDQSVINGESLPADRGIGDQLYCGTINCFGSVDIRVTAAGQDTSLQKLVHLVQQAQTQQAPIQRIADRWAAWLVPVALLLAVVAGLLRQDVVVAVTVLVVFCPCALVLATPTAVMAAIGQASRRGVIIKSGAALERMGTIDTLAIDKTGTLTCGTLQLCDIYPLDEGISKDQLLRYTAAVEQRSEHPLGKAVAASCKELPEVADFTMCAGKGVAGRVEGKTVLCGSRLFLEEKGVALSEQAVKIMEQLQNQGKATVLTAVDGLCAGILGLSDTLRSDAQETIAQLNALGVKTVLLTGDQNQTARYFAQQAGITQVHGQLLPEQKVQVLSRYRDQGCRICMVGDGVNDAPSLKTADVGVAMGSMDITVDAADIVLTGNQLSRLPYLKRLSNATVKTIRIAIALSLLINIAAIVLSFFSLLTPTTGALVHNAGSVLVILFAALLYDREFK